MLGLTRLKRTQGGNKMKRPQKRAKTFFEEEKIRNKVLDEMKRTRDEKQLINKFIVLMGKGGLK